MGWGAYAATNAAKAAMVAMVNLIFGVAEFPFDRLCVNELLVVVQDPSR